MVWAPVSLSLKFELYQWHKSFGALVFGLTLLRLAWRLSHKVPPFPSALKPWERVAAKSTHYSLYALCLIMPIVGWTVVSTAAFNVPTLLFQRIYLPHIPFLASHPDKIFLDWLTSLIHLWLAGVIAGLILLHIAGTLKHRFFDGNDVLGRMLPARKDPSSPELK